VDMMEDVLAFARGSVSVAPRDVELGPWFSELVDYLRRELDLSMVEVSLRGDLQGTARFDPARLRRVLCNLAWNARDAMPDGGRLDIEVRREEAALRIACTDSGPGVAPEVRPRLFTEFATFGKANGTGLGLALSRSIVEEHGGSLRYEDAEGGGARFVALLPQPLSAQAAPEGAPRPATAGAPGPRAS
jgi:two-component system NtrC family sensor kinase